LIRGLSTNKKVEVQGLLKSLDGHGMKLEVASLGSIKNVFGIRQGEIEINQETSQGRSLKFSRVIL